MTTPTITRNFFTTAPKAYDYESLTYEASANTSIELYPGRRVSGRRISGRDVSITGSEYQIQYQVDRYLSGLYLVQEL